MVPVRGVVEEFAVDSTFGVSWVATEEDVRRLLRRVAPLHTWIGFTMMLELETASPLNVLRRDDVVPVMGSQRFESMTMHTGSYLGIHTMSISPNIIFYITRTGS